MRVNTDAIHDRAGRATRSVFDHEIGTAAPVPWLHKDTGVTLFIAQ